MIQNHFFLGLDGGGTKTKAVLINSQKKVLESGEAEGSNAHIIGYKISAKNVTLAIKNAVNHFESSKFIGCLAIAGIDSNHDKHSWNEIINNDPYLTKIFDSPPLIVNDSLAALKSGTEDKNALVIIAGTGSNCYGVNEKGQNAKSSGLDYILSDQGSAYDMGLKILKNVVKDLDGRGEKTILSQLLFEKLNINSLEDLTMIAYKKPWDKTHIAELAPLIQTAVQKNDVIANQIIEESADELSLMIKSVAEKLNLSNKKFTIVTTGSVFKLQNLILNLLEKRILKFAPHANFVKPKIDSATAAAYLALEKSLLEESLKV